MAEKKYQGAPFGTQTARFDVTGVHPKNKVPGSFTQIPYDKYSMVDLSTALNYSPEAQSQLKGKIDKLRKMDGHLANIRQSLSLANDSMDDIYVIKHGESHGNSTDISVCGTLDKSSKESRFTVKKQEKEKPNLFPKLKRSMLKFQHCESNLTRRNLSIFSNQQVINAHKTGYNYNTSYTGTTDWEKKNQAASGLQTGSNKGIGQLNHSCSNQFDDNNENQSTEAEKCDIKSEDNTCDNGSEPQVSVDQRESPEPRVSSTVVESASRRSTLVDAVIKVGSLIQGMKQTRKQSLQFNVPSVTDQVNVNEPDGDFDIELQHHSTEDIHPRLSIDDDRRFTEEGSVHELHGADSAADEDLKDKSSTPRTSRRSTLKGKAKVILAATVLRSSVFEKDEPLKLRKIVYTKTEPCDVTVKRKLGPGAYNVMMGGFSSKTVEEKASGPGWSRQLEVERLAALPHLLHKEQWEQNKMLKRKLGPGSYEIKDFIQLGNEKPRSGRGICDNLAPRFEKGVQSSTPGPGTYGIGGVPQRALEDKDIKSQSTKGMLDAGDRKRNLPSVGSHLGPGTYQHKTCTDEMLNKVTSLKGPYKLFSGDRNKPISDGYFAAPKLADLGPGQYEIRSFVDELGMPPRANQGHFGKVAQYPEVPTDRIFLFSQAHYPKMKDSPGPGAYEPSHLKCCHSVNSPGFLSSAKRDDKMSQIFFTRNFNPVGAGRYDVQKFEEAQDVNGHSSVFKSKTGKPNLQMGKFLQERIRAKDVKVEDRVVLYPPNRVTRSITVM